MPNLLPKHDPAIILRWNVCEKYRDAGRRNAVVRGKDKIDAYDVMGLEIRAVDRVWMLLRSDGFLPAEVLKQAMDKIRGGASILKNPHARAEAEHESRRREKNGDHFGSATCIASAIVKYHDPKKLDVDNNYYLEYQRQLIIIREGLDAWISKHGETENAETAETDDRDGNV